MNPLQRTFALISFVLSLDSCTLCLSINIHIGSHTHKHTNTHDYIGSCFVLSLSLFAFSSRTWRASVQRNSYAAHRRTSRMFCWCCVGVAKSSIASAKLQSLAVYANHIWYSAPIKLHEFAVCRLRFLSCSHRRWAGRARQPQQPQQQSYLWLMECCVSCRCICWLKYLVGVKWLAVIFFNFNFCTIAVNIDELTTSFQTKRELFFQIHRVQMYIP